MNILSRFRVIKIFVFAIDGVITDGTLLLNANGPLLHRVYKKDGYALQLAIKAGYKIIIVSENESVPVSEYLQKLGIAEIFMKVDNKETFLKNYVEKNNYKPEEVLFMGDDIPDYSSMQIAGFCCCPIDAAVEIKQISSYISPFKGGYGCVRDVIEKVLKLNNNWPLKT